MFDTGRRMQKAIAELSREVGWTLESVLRPCRLFTPAQLFGLYKSQILSYVKSDKVTYYPAAPSLLRRINRFQKQFLYKINVTPEQAFEKCSLACFTNKRDIRICELLNNIVLGNAPYSLLLRSRLLLQILQRFSASTFKFT